MPANFKIKVVETMEMVWQETQCRVVVARAVSCKHRYKVDRNGGRMDVFLAKKCIKIPDPLNFTVLMQMWKKWI